MKKIICPDCGGSKATTVYKGTLDYTCPTCQGKDLYEKVDPIEVPDGFEFNYIHRNRAFFRKNGAPWPFLEMIPHQVGSEIDGKICTKIKVNNKSFVSLWRCDGR